MVYKLKYLLLLVMVILFHSCNNMNWDNHYINEPAKTTHIRLTQYIESDTSLSTFYQMLTITGFDSILNKDQCYTVWAPNNLALQNINLSDTILVEDIVKNHIARFSRSVAGVNTDTVLMINGKLIVFSKSGNGYLFGDKNVTGGEILTANGIIHKIDGYVPYKINIWEYIQRTEGLDSLRNYIQEQNQLKFRPDLSIVIGYSGGNKIYDSVKVLSNLLFDKIGSLNSEDSIFSVLLPNNIAWTEAYNRISPYFVSNSLTNAAQIQRAFTRFTIVRDMVYRKPLQNPAIFDSLVSTTGNVFHNVSGLFPSGPGNLVSNGYTYITSKMPFKDTLSWHKILKVEAENSFNRTFINANIYTRGSEGSNLQVSNSTYIQVEPTSTSSKASVDFPIPGRLSAKYNIYCVFVPTSIVNPNDKKPFKVSFALLTYTNGRVKATALPVTKNITDTTSITKMKIASNFKFPDCDIALDENKFPVLKNKTSNVTIRVQNEAISSSDLAKYGRIMQIDCLILEPIAQ